jgi:integrase
MASVRKRSWRSAGETKTAWAVDYFDRHRERHIKTFAKKKDADAYLISSQQEVRDATHTPTA